jgi:uncharacterized protein (DUF2062 family)
MKEFFKRKVADPLLSLLNQGITPSKLALAVTAGAIIAVVPIFGSSTLLCLLAIWLLRLNPVAVLIANQVAYPLLFVLFLPFIRIGQWLFRTDPIPFSISEIFTMFQRNFWTAIQTIWWSMLYATVAWILLAFPVGYVLYLLLSILFTKIRKA